MKNTILIIFILLLPFSLFARDNELSQAAKAYNDSNYVKAIGIYQDLLKEKGADSGLLYNLGNAYLRMENYGAAILNYRKALKYDAFNYDAKENLRYAEHQVAIANEVQLEDKNLDPTPQSYPFMRRLRDTLESPGSNALAWTSGILFVLMCMSAALYVFSADARRKKIGFFSAIGSFLLSAAALTLSFSAKASAQRVDECVLMAPVASMKQQPSSDAKNVATPITGGTQLRVLGESRASEKGDSTRWIHVYLNDDFTGWLPYSDVEMVKL